MTESALRRAAWTIWAVSLTILAIEAIAEGLDVMAGRVPIPSAPDIAQALLISGVQVVVATLGALIVTRFARNPIGWIFVAVGLLISVGGAAGSYASAPASHPGAAIAAWLANLAQGAVVFGAFTFLFLLFPNGRLLSSRWRPATWVATAALALVTLSEALLPGPLQSYPSIRNPLGVGPLEAVLNATFAIAFWAVMLSLVAAAASLVLRFRRSHGEERQQLMWVASATVLAALLLLSGPLFWIVLPSPLADWWPAVFFLAVAIIPTSIGVAMLKYRLYDIDLIINRTLVYGGLTIGVVGLYVLVVGYLGNVLRIGNNLGVSLLATGIVAVLFQPVHEHLQRGVNYLMYGERDDPYTVISRLGQRLEGTLSPEAILPAVVETVAQALKLPYAAIAVREDEVFTVAAATGVPVAESLTLPLTYQQETVGQLLLAPRAAGEAFNLADRRLLEDLARQAGIAAHAVRLTADLQRSRERLVTTREEERRRLRRDLHDGLGPTLAAQTLKVGSARSLYPYDPAAADALLAELERDMEASLADIRRLVYNLRPPALDELGLVGAIRDSVAVYCRPRATEAGDRLSVSIDAPEDLPTLPAAAEVAAYRIVQEALTNVVRHARAQSCRIRLAIARDGGRVRLEVTVSDDGIGLPPAPKAGVGLSSMRERALELGGTCTVETLPGRGTVVSALIPLTSLVADTESAGESAPTPGESGLRR